MKALYVELSLYYFYCDFILYNSFIFIKNVTFWNIETQPEKSDVHYLSYSLDISIYNAIAPTSRTGASATACHGVKMSAIKTPEV